MNRLARRLLITIAALLVLYGLALVLYSIQPQVNDAGLRPARENPQGNAFGTLELAVAQVWWPKEKNPELSALVKDTNWDAALASTAVANNQEALKLLDAAMAMPSLEVPEFQMNDLLPYLSGWRRLSEVAAIRANALFHAGREAEAFQEGLRLVRLGRRMEESKGAVLHYLVGAAVKGQGLYRMRGWTARTRLTPRELADIAAELEQVPSDGNALVESLRAEYSEKMTCMADIRSGRLPAEGEVGRFVPIRWAPVYNHGKTRRLFANATQNLIDSADLPYAKAKLPNFDRRPNPARLLLSGNLAGEAFFWMSMPADSDVLARHCQENVELETTRLLLAMRAYQMKNQRLPETLEALVPDFIPAVPTDAFSGEPLLYSRERKVIYSVGKNLRDDDGQIVKENYKQLDSGCSVEF